MRTPGRIGGILVAAGAALALVALASVSAAEPAAGSPSAKLGLVTTRDVVGLKSVGAPSAGRQAWSTLLPATARASSAVGVLRGLTVAIVSRAALTRSAAQANAVSRTLRRLSTAQLAHLDRAAVSHGQLAPGTAHAIWTDGSWVGQVSVLGAGRSGAALARAAAAGVRTRITRALAETAWDKVLDQVRPNGTVSAGTALQAFSLAVAPLPGVRVPSGPVGVIPDGTLAIDWVLSKFDQLSQAQQTAVTQALNELNGSPHKSIRMPADVSAREHAADWQPDAYYQKLAEEEAGALGAKLGRPLTLKLRVGRDAIGAVYAVTQTLNASGGWQTGPPTDCEITVGTAGQKLNKTGVYLREILAHEVFHCYQGQIAGLPQAYDLPAWVTEGGSNWAACNVVPGALPDGAWKGYLKSPDQELFQRAYDGLGLWSLLSQHGIDLWTRWPAIIAVASTANFSAYAKAVGAEEDQILWSWAASYAQDAARGADWDVAGHCKPKDTNTPPKAANVANGSDAKIVVPNWTVSLVSLFSSADVVHLEVGSGQVRLSSGSLDERLQGEADYCTSSAGNCTCPGSSETLKRINKDGGTLIALTGGPTGTEATVAGMSLEDYCNGGKPSRSCSRLSAKQVRSVLGLANAVLLDTPIYSSPDDPDVNFGCEMGAWNGAKPTDAGAVLQKALSGNAAQVAYETWVPNGGPNADQWPDEFAQLAKGFSQGVFPNLAAPGTATRFSPSGFGYGSAGVTTKLGPPYVGLDFAGACWWNGSTLSATCLGVWEADGKPVVAHLKKLAAIAIPKSLG